MDHLLPGSLRFLQAGPVFYASRYIVISGPYLGSEGSTQEGGNMVKGTRGRRQETESELMLSH
jgi:hypothetical protein